MNRKLKLPKKLELEFLADSASRERFSKGKDKPPEQRIRLLDPATGTSWGFVVVDDTRRGPGLGGLRIAPDLTLEEVGRLARVMTWKNSAAMLPFGGGKAGLIADPCFLAGHPGLKRDLIAMFAEAIFPIEQYTSAPDMGTDERDIQLIYEINSRRLGTEHHMRGGAGRPTEKGGIPLDEWGLTAQGLFAAAQILETLDADFKIRNARVVIQGYGNVGSGTAAKLHEVGAVIVGASDIHVGLWNPDGLDVAALNAARRHPDGLQTYSGPVKKKFAPPRLDWLMEAPCDVLVPAARPDAITSRNADRIQCRVILQGANTPISKMTEYYLKNRRGILSLSDFIVNVGGVIGCAVELKLNGDAAYRKQVRSQGARSYLDDLIYNTVSRNVMEIHRRLAENSKTDVLFREEALALARERLESSAGEYWL